MKKLIVAAGAAFIVTTGAAQAASCTVNLKIVNNHPTHVAQGQIFSKTRANARWTKGGIRQNRNAIIWPGQDWRSTLRYAVAGCRVKRAVKYEYFCWHKDTRVHGRKGVVNVGMHRPKDLVLRPKC